MTTVQKEKIGRRKLSLPTADSGGSVNVSKACRIVAYSRQQFYEIRRNFQLYGAEGLIDQLPGATGSHANRVSEEVERQSWSTRLSTRRTGHSASLTSCC